MKTSTQQIEKTRSVDFTLLLSRMEEDIMAGRKQEVWRDVLTREAVWKRTDPEKQLRWARTAQMAGEVETAIRVFTYINHTRPEITEAWIERFELLLILDKRKEMAGLLAASKGHIGEKTYSSWLKLCNGLKKTVSNESIGDAITPFAELRRRQNAVRHYLSLFSGRKDCFARQWINKQEGKQGYVPVRRPIEEKDIEEHLSSRKTYGIYLIKSDATVKAAVIDVDIKKQFRNRKLKADEMSLIKRERSYLLSRITELSEKIGLKPVIEFSGGKGFHFWFFFSAPIPAGEAKRHLTDINKSISRDLTAFNLEVFPKQDQLSGKGLGNLVKLPLGVHRLSGKRSYFLKCHDRSTDAQLDFLSKVTPTDPARISPREKEGQDQKVMIHPRWQKWAEDYPELFKLETLCIPLAQIIATCREGNELSFREEKVLFQTIGFLPGAKTLLHYLMACLPDYNPHLVDFKLSRLRGTPLGCKRIHSLLNFNGDICPFEEKSEYAHPLLHIEAWNQGESGKSEKVENLTAALDNLKLAMSQVRRFLT